MEPPAFATVGPLEKPVKNLNTARVAMSCDNTHASCIRVKIAKVPEYTCLRPTTSDKGENINGPLPKPKRYALFAANVVSNSDSR